MSGNSPDDGMKLGYARGNSSVDGSNEAIREVPVQKIAVMRL